MIEGVVFEDIPGAHDDARRTLVPVFNMDLPFKPAQQLKIAAMKTNAVLGGHRHPYAELFTVTVGKAVFSLTNPANGEVEAYELVPGKRLLVPTHVWHEAQVDAGTTLIGLTEEKYISPEHNDIKL